MAPRHGAGVARSDVQRRPCPGRQRRDPRQARSAVAHRGDATARWPRGPMHR